MWFRRDLRVQDNAALSHALQHCAQVHCVFVFDTAILQDLPRQDRRVEFIRESLLELDAALRQLAAQVQPSYLGTAGTADQPGAGLIVLHALAESAVPLLAHSLGVQAVFANHDYEPLALARDAAVRGALANAGIAWHSCKDQVIFEREEVLTQMGRPYGVFTPYKNAWLKKLQACDTLAHPVAQHAAALAQRPAPEEVLRTLSVLDAPAVPSEVASSTHTRSLPGHVPSLQELGFEPSNLASLKVRCGAAGAQALLQDFLPRMAQYQAARDFPAVKGPSYLSVHLRFGTVSIRQLVALALPLVQQGNQGAATWLSELIWRDFYFQILANFPQVASGSFKREYDAIHWEHGKHALALFAAWCEGRTGYPLVDAAMAQINQTGYMHNRLRMVVASFLCKDLGLDWRWGERYFAQHLIDFDLAANNGGWQWANSSGCDAQPYFRIFNPLSQSEKFDAQGKFIRRYLPQLAALPNEALHAPWLASSFDLLAAGVKLGQNYPRPIVDHAQARLRTLERYACVKKSV